jgi:hypothetical protein
MVVDGIPQRCAAAHLKFMMVLWLWRVGRGWKVAGKLRDVIEKNTGGK